MTGLANAAFDGDPIFDTKVAFKIFSSFLKKLHLTTVEWRAGLRPGVVL